MSSNVPIYATDLWCPVGHFNPDQADKYAELCHEIKPRFVFETGFGSGRSAACVLYYSRGTVQKMISIEKNLDYISPAGRAMAVTLSQKFPGFCVIEKWARDAITPSFFSEAFPEGLDFVTVDGEHNYEGCMFDLEQAGPHVRIGGLIVIDDYHSGPPNGYAFPEVTQAVDDFATLRHRNEFDKTSWHREGKGFCFLRRGAATR